MSNKAIEFMMSYAAFQVFGYDSERSFQLVAKDFKRLIRAIKLTRRKGLLYSRTYFFTDNSSCSYQEEHFKIKSKN